MEREPPARISGYDHRGPAPLALRRSRAPHRNGGRVLARRAHPRGRVERRAGHPLQPGSAGLPPSAPHRRGREARPGQGAHHLLRSAGDPRAARRGRQVHRGEARPGHRPGPRGRLPRRAAAHRLRAHGVQRGRRGGDLPLARLPAVRVVHSLLPMYARARPPAGGPGVRPHAHRARAAAERAHGTDLPELPVQPHRRGRHQGPADRARRADPRAHRPGRARVLGRVLRGDHLRRRRAHLDRGDARHGGAHDHRVGRLEDLRVDRRPRRVGGLSHARGGARPPQPRHQLLRLDSSLQPVGRGRGRPVTREPAGDPRHGRGVPAPPGRGRRRPERHRRDHLPEPQGRVLRLPERGGRGGAHRRRRGVRGAASRRADRDESRHAVPALSAARLPGRDHGPPVVQHARQRGPALPPALDRKR